MPAGAILPRSPFLALVLFCHIRHDMKKHRSPGAFPVFVVASSVHASPQPKHNASSFGKIAVHD
jgi:hypothetical protein